MQESRPGGRAEEAGPLEEAGELKRIQGHSCGERQANAAMA